MNGCVLYLPFYKYGSQVSKIWDQSPEVYGPNLALNGEMEVGDPPTGTNIAGTPAVYERSSAKVYSGTYSAHIVDSTPSQGGFYTINEARKLNAIYRFSYSYFLVEGILRTVFGNGLGNGQAIERHITTGQWIRIVRYVVCSAAGVNGGWLFGGDDVDPVPTEFYIDAVEVQEMVGGHNDGVITGAAPGSYPIFSGTELVTNGNFDSNTNGWGSSSGTIAVIAGGQSGNCLELTRVDGDNQTAWTPISLIDGKKYKFSVWIKSGTSGNESVTVGVWDDVLSWLPEYVNTVSSGTWTRYELIFDCPSGRGNTYALMQKLTATPGTMLFDSASVQEVTGYESLGWGLDGLDDYVYSPVQDITAISLIGWIRLPTQTSFNNAVTRRIFQITALPATFNLDLTLLSAAGDEIFSFYTPGTGWISAGFTVNWNNWVCVAITIDATTLNTYQNGAVKANVATSISTSGSRLDIGYNRIGNDHYTNMNVGDVLLFNRALTAKEIKAYYDNTRHTYGA
jgi:uncharacterized protein (DUF779 family)